MYNGRKLTENEIRAIEDILNCDDRAEVIPTKNGVKIVKIHREQVNKEPPSKR